MLDSNWETINGEVAHQIEVLNYANQVHVIEALIKFIIAVGGLSVSGASAQAPNVNALKELHRTATLFLLNSPGTFRIIPVHVASVDGTVRHQPPDWEHVDHHIVDFFNSLQSLWIDQTPIYIAAFCLWKINWIHPFRNGNGRSARAFAYACLCLKYGFALPGKVTVIDLIMTREEHRKAYDEALNLSDRIYKNEDRIDVKALEALLEKLLIEQLSSINIDDQDNAGIPNAD